MPPRSDRIGNEPLIVPPPGTVYAEVGSALRLTTFVKGTSVVLRVNLRQRLQNGRVVSMRRDFTPATLDGTQSVFDISIGPGAVEYLSVWLQSGTLHYGNAFIEVAYVPNRPASTSASADNAEILIQGQLAAGKVLAYPTFPGEPSQSMRAWTKGIAVSNPAAGAEIVYTVASQVNLFIEGIIFTLTTDANVANRTVSFQFDRGTAGSVNWRTQSRTVQTAGVPRTYFVYPIGSIPTDLTAYHYLYMPNEVTLRSTWGFRTVTANIQAGDQFSGVVILAKEIVAP